MSDIHKIKLITKNANPSQSKLYLDGKELKGASKFEIICEADKPIEAIITFLADIDIEGDMKVIVKQLKRD